MSRPSSKKNKEDDLIEISEDDSDNMYNESDDEIEKEQDYNVKDKEEQDTDSEEEEDLTPEETEDDESLSDTNEPENECLYNEPIDDDEQVKEEFVPDDKRITKPILFKFERVRLIGDRAKQLALGAKPMIKGAKHLDSKTIAKLELDNNIIPLYIVRPLPNKKKERWTIGELAH